MNEEFVTRAIENDRCLKAHRLLDRFETEVRAELERMGQEMVEVNPHLFLDDPGSNVKIQWETSTIIANARDNLQLDRINEGDPSTDLYLNISLRWVDPIDWGHRDMEGALCAACYKINGGDRDDYERVKSDTSNEEWDVNFAQDQYNNAPGVVYVPVETADDFQIAIEELRDHFEVYGDYWGVEPSNTESGN